VALVIGALLAFAVGLFATGLGLDRDRAFYPVVTIVIASYYALSHGALMSNPGVPRWWPEFCLTYDVTAAAYLARRLERRRIRAAA
jgi:hypothetical protein